MFRCGQGAVGAVGDDPGKRVVEEMVEFFEEGATGLGEGGEPGGGHADALDTLAGEEESSFRTGGSGGGGASSWIPEVCMVRGR